MCIGDCFCCMSRLRVCKKIFRNKNYITFILKVKFYTRVIVFLRKISSSSVSPYFEHKKLVQIFFVTTYVLIYKMNIPSKVNISECTYIAHVIKTLNQELAIKM